jgi:hypothetical protein
MKKLFFLVLLLLYQLGFSQQIMQVQYWFGNNFAGKITTAINTNSNDETNFDILFPYNGINQIDADFHCRFLDSDGNWSAIYSQQMTNNNDVSTTLVKIEYWFDDNITNKTLLNTNTVSIGNILDHQELDIPWTLDAQVIHYRFKSLYNTWSSIQSSNLQTTVYQNNLIDSVEYWFGDNFVNRLPLPVVANANNEINLDFPFPDDGINKYDETVHYRFKDKIGNWSSIYSEQMTNNNDTIASAVEVQYWFDDNFSGKLTVPTTQFLNGTQIDHQEADLPWQENAQTIHYRFRSKYNQWSPIQSSNIDDIENRDNRIVGVEYWIENNFITPNYVSVNQTGIVYYDERDLSSINLDPCNPQTIYIRYKDKMNRWSGIYSFYHGVAEPGITVLVHGFQLFGGSSPTGDFETIGHEILQKAGGGIMYKNDANTGLLVPLEGTYQSDKEIVLIYDWGDLSNNGIVPLTSGNGYLEAAADNLLSSIINLKTAVGLNNISSEEFLSKPKHFIGHSRGGIVLLQLAHRFKNYFPNISIEQATFLDPHPATTFGDMNGDYTLIQPPNLPCVNGQATACGTGITGCDTVGSGDFLKLPENIEKADCYYREDNNFEGLFNGISLDWGQFDGLPFQGLGNFNRKIDNSVLNVGSPAFGGTHSGVHKWYLGTVNTNDNFDVADGYLSLSSAHTNTTNWYSNLMTSSTSNNFLQTESRCSTGFYYSRLGGGLNNLPTITTGKASIAEMNFQNAVRDLYFTDNNNVINLLGEAPHNVFNGNFNYDTEAGWTKNGGSTGLLDIIENKKANLSFSKPSIKHSFMYFGSQYRSLKIETSDATALLSNPIIRVIFYNNLNTQVGITYELEFTESNKIIYVPLPLDIIGQVGTFQIEKGSTSSSFSLDNIQLLDSIPGHEVPRIVNLKLNIEGYYDTTTHEMRPVKANQGIGSSVTDVGDITVELVNPDNHETIATISTVLKTNGTATCNFPTVPHGTYYIVVKHRNAIQTWSATPVLVSAIPITYDFSNDVNKVYGSNTVELESGVYGFYSGDINQDEIIDPSDYSMWETDYNDFSFGNFSTDLNGDGIVDASDYSIWESNYNHFTFSSHP